MCFCSKIKQIVQNCTKTSSSANFSRYVFTSIVYQLALLLLVVLLTLHSTDAGSITKGLTARMRSAKIANIHEELLPLGMDDARPPAITTYRDKKYTSKSSAAADVAGKYKIRSVSGEPNYKSVNLTWEVEFEPARAATTSSSSADDAVDAVTNSSAEVEPPKAFQVFFCELQSFGPHRCRSKLVDETSQQLEPSDGDDEHNEESQLALEGINRKVRHYSVQIENLRMATKYSFHIRPQMKRRNMKITGRSELFDNEIGEGVNSMNFGGQTIVIPTKGFSAQATQCLPHASEIEVETGPYFGGKIVVDGGNCGVKGNPDDPKDKYTMRIDHKMCGSLVKPETNTVETFITVQENLGIFTHSTRRFVVVCSFQSGMQTVRASFTVPGKDGIAAPVENDPFEPDDRFGREQRYMRYVDKSALVLKENLEDELPAVSEESDAVVTEVRDPLQDSGSDNREGDTQESIAILEDIIPGVNEHNIKHENDVVKETNEEKALPMRHTESAKYAKLMVEHVEHNDGAGPAKNWLEQLTSDDLDSGRAFTSSLHFLSANLGNVILTVSVTVIIIGVFVFIVHREVRRHQFKRSKSNTMLHKHHSQQQQQKQQSQQQQQNKYLRQNTLPRSLQQNFQGTM